VGRHLWFTQYYCFVRNSNKKPVINEGMENPTTAIVAADSTKLDGGGRVLSGKYLPTREEVFHHNQVKN
jgi:hypothetical protein